MLTLKLLHIKTSLVYQTEADSRSHDDCDDGVTGSKRTGMYLGAECSDSIDTDYLKNANLMQRSYRAINIQVSHCPFWLKRIAFPPNTAAMTVH